MRKSGIADRYANSNRYANRNAYRYTNAYAKRHANRDQSGKLYTHLQPVQFNLDRYVHQLS